MIGYAVVHTTWILTLFAERRIERCLILKKCDGRA